MDRVTQVLNSSRKYSQIFLISYRLTIHLNLEYFLILRKLYYCTFFLEEETVNGGLNNTVGGKGET